MAVRVHLGPYGLPWVTAEFIETVHQSSYQSWRHIPLPTSGAEEHSRSPAPRYVPLYSADIPLQKKSEVCNVSMLD